MQGELQLRIVSAAAAILVGLAGCNGTRPPVIGPVAAIPVASDGQVGYALDRPAEYLLRPADVITVTVFREPSLSLERVPVGAGGSVDLPLIGPVKAEGLTPEAFAREIEGRLASGYLRDPQVSVNVMQYASHQVTVEGAVEKPGIYEFQPGTRLSGAIALANGPKRVARKSQVAVFRHAIEGLEVAKFDYAAMQQGTMIDPVLRPGDRVVVGTSGLSQFWQDLLQALPAFGLFTRL